MNPNQYQRLAIRTESSHANVAPKLANSLRLTHAILGLSSEVGELADSFKKHCYYGQDLDVDNIFEELGDCLWYIALACDAMGFEMKGVMRANIRKLQERYPDKFKEVLAKEENRNRDTERKTIERSRQEEIPRGEADKLKLEARNKAKKKHLCRHCGNPISDEVVRQLHLPTELGGRESTNCPMCKEAITEKLLQVLE